MSSEDKADRGSRSDALLFIPVERRCCAVESRELNDLLDPEGSTRAADEMKTVTGNGVILAIPIPGEYKSRRRLYRWSREKSLRIQRHNHMVLVGSMLHPYVVRLIALNVNTDTNVFPW